MFTKLREPFGTAGLLVAIVALVFALAGGAYAASGALNGTQKKEVEKIAKKFSGKPGAAGPAGTAGKEGPKGAAGTDGTNGTNGTSGTNGTNGTNGTTGFTATLPGGQTETGVWAVKTAPVAAISFPIPLEAPLTAAHVFFVTKAEVEGHTAPAECPGSAGEPEAAEGNLCVYEGFGSEVTNTASRRPTFTEAGASTTGSIFFFGLEEENSFAIGGWAVTAE